MTEYRLNFIKKAVAIIATILLTLVFLIPPDTVFGAEESRNYGYTTKEFKTEVKAKENNTMDFTEKITIDFATGHHSIFRRIPANPKRMKITGIDVPGEDFTVQTKSKGDDIFYVIQIRSSEEITGEKTYTIKYTIENYNDENASSDYIGLNLIPAEWEYPIEHAEGKLIMPKDVDWSRAGFYCGRYGSQGSPVNSRTFKSGYEGNTAWIEGNNIPDCYGASVETVLPEGYWKDVKAYRSPGIDASILFVIAGAVSVILWGLFGRSVRVNTIYMNHPPENLSPAEIRVASGGAVTAKDIISEIFYFERKGYLKIEKEDGEIFRLVKVADIPDTEKPYASALFNSIFNGRESVRTDVMYEGFARDVEKSRRLLEIERENARKKHLYTSASLHARRISLLLLLGAILGAALRLYLEGGYAKTTIGSGILILLVGSHFAQSSFNQLVDNFAVSGIGKKISHVVVGVGSLALLVYFFRTMSYQLLEVKYYGVIMTIGAFAVIGASAFMRARTNESVQFKGELKGFKKYLEKGASDSETEEHIKDMIAYAYAFGLCGDWVKGFENCTEIMEAEDNTVCVGSDIETLLLVGKRADKKIKKKKAE